MLFLTALPLIYINTDTSKTSNRLVKKKNMAQGVLRIYMTQFTFPIQEPHFHPSESNLKWCPSGLLRPSAATLWQSGRVRSWKWQTTHRFRLWRDTTPPDLFTIFKLSLKPNGRRGEWASRFGLRGITDERAGSSLLFSKLLNKYRVFGFNWAIKETRWGCLIWTFREIQQSPEEGFNKLHGDFQRHRQGTENKWGFVHYSD